MDVINRNASVLEQALRVNDTARVLDFLEEDPLVDRRQKSLAVKFCGTRVLDAMHEHGASFTEPLLLSAVPSKPDILHWLLQHGANPDLESNGWTAVSIVLEDPRSSLEEIHTMLRLVKDPTKGSLFHRAIERICDDEQKLGLLEAVTDLRVPINQIEYEGTERKGDVRPVIYGLGTPLHKAVNINSYKCVKFLLEKGASYTIIDSKGRLAEDIAAAAGRADLCALLQQARQLV